MVRHAHREEWLLRLTQRVEAATTTHSPPRLLEINSSSSRSSNMCKSSPVAVGPIEAQKAKVNIFEDNSSSFLNVHLPSVSYVGAAILVALIIFALWKLAAYHREQRVARTRRRELELQIISKGTTRGSRPTTIDFGEPQNESGVVSLDMPSAVITAPKSCRMLEGPKF